MERVDLKRSSTNKNDWRENRDLNRGNDESWKKGWWIGLHERDNEQVNNKFEIIKFFIWIFLLFFKVLVMKIICNF